MKKLALLLLSASASTAFAVDMHTKVLASTCYNCHGPEGVSSAAIPGLAGQEKSYLLQAMLESKSGSRASTVMQKYMLGYTDMEMDRMAEYFASLK